MLIVPEVEWDVDEVAARLNRLIEQGNTRATLVISEHCWDNMKPFDWRKFLNDNGKTVYPGEPISAEYLASILKRKCGGAEVRSTVSAALSPPRRTAPSPSRPAIRPCSCSTAALPIRLSASVTAASSICPSSMR